ncbi:MAG: NAD(P)-binding domain-containing protein, partial [Pseudomonadota bacterium]|nr:NAD(P)-binding domain-containing protein [Pseudomonadota bacterium]
MADAAAPVFKRLAIIGHGLIGSSISRAVRRADGLVGHIAVADNNPATRAASAALELADSVHDDPLAAATGADCVVLCTPVGT